MGIGVLGVFMLLSFQFRSYTEPLIVNGGHPVCTGRRDLRHVLLGIDLSMPSLLGFVSLAGIVVNDSILLVLFIKMARKDGKALEDAAAQASRQRFRAIAITSLTTIAGLLPLLSEQSLQAQVLIPLAVSIAFGPDGIDGSGATRDPVPLCDSCRTWPLTRRVDCGTHTRQAGAIAAFVAIDLNLYGPSCG